MNAFEKLALRKFKLQDLVHNATILLLGRRRSGKCLKKGTGVLMYDGRIKKIEDIIIGDLVMGDDSTSRKVLGLNNGIDIMYRITNENDESYTVNSEHILSLKYKYKNMIKDELDKSAYDVYWFDKIKISVCSKTFSYNNRNKSDVYCDAKLFLEEIERRDKTLDISIKKYLSLSKKETEHVSFFGYQAVIDFKQDSYPSHLKLDPYTFGYDISLTKLPFDYKCNSRENRLQLLAGIIDKNGELVKNGIKLDCKNDELMNDIIYLIKSLGFVYHKQVIYGNLDEIPTKIKKELVENFDEEITFDVESKIKIEKLDYGEYYGFELDGNHRFVLGNFIVTHNSYLVRDIFYNHKSIPLGLIFSGTEEANPFFGDFIPDSFIHADYEPSLIENLILKQSRKIKKAKSNGYYDTNGLKPGNRAFVVLDDMLQDASVWKREKTVQTIFYNGRHYNLFFILTMQYPLGIPPGLRTNIDYVFVFNEPSIKNRKKIYEDYAGSIPSFDHFCNILDSCTSDHHCLVIKTSGNSTDLRDQIFWYKAAIFDKFKVGHPKIWEYHDAHYNKKYDEERDVEQEELDKLKRKFAKTKKLKVIVSRQGVIQDAIEETDSE